jgi:hypothetical protein
MTQTAPQESLTREITATREEFARGIVAAFADVMVTADGWTISWGGARAELCLSPLPDLAIGLIRLPRLLCRIDLIGGAAADRSALLARLDLYQHRGGG